MHGLFGTYGQALNWDLRAYDHLLNRKAVTGPVCVEQRTLDKFVDDKPFVDTPDYCYALEGVLFGPTTDLAVLYEQYGETFMRELRGSFSGLFYDKKQDILLVFTDHIGDKMIFCYQDPNGVAFASDWQVLTHALSPRCTRRWSEEFAWSMLSFGFSPRCLSPIDGIQRLGAGEYLRVQGQRIERLSYFRFDNTSRPISEKEAVARLDTLFKQAVQRVIEKNQQYGLNQCMSLSAGLDSRMSVAVARSLTMDPITTITYSQSGYYDETIPKQIAQQWHCSSHFTRLDEGNYLCDIDQVASQTQGLVNYSGAAQVDYGWREIDKVHCGVVLTGMLGDIVINSRYAKQMPVYPEMTAISQRYIDRVSEVGSEGWDNNEMYYLYVRGFNCANLGTPLVVQLFSESYSPFYDVDLLAFCLTLPKQMRFAYHLYDRWILQCYPQAAQWLHNGVRPIGFYPRQLTLFHRTLPIKDLPRRICWYLCKQLHIYDFYKQHEGESMNPEDDWIKTNPTLREALRQYYETNKHLLGFSPALSKAAEDLYENGTAMEKFNVLSLLSTLRSN